MAIRNPGVRGHSLVAMAVAGKRVYFGCNSSKTHPMVQIRQVDGVVTSSHHAEFDLLKRIPDRELRKAEIYVLRFGKSGQMLLARPCKHCLAMLYRAGVKPRQINYTTVSGRVVNEAACNVGSTPGVSP